MALIKHSGLQEFLSGSNPFSSSGVVLICGESFLIDQALSLVTGFLLKKEDRWFGLESLDGAAVPMGDIIEQAATFSFLPGPKVVLVKNGPIFTPATGTGQAYKEKDLDLLTGLIEKGLPEHHFLVITSQGIDRRKKIVKAVQKKGLVVDCSVPMGARKADMAEQSAVLMAVARDITSKAGKTLAPNAFAALEDMTGFRPRLFAQNLEKLVAYTGKNKTISIEQVKTLVKREKKDPVFLLTNAVLDRNVSASLFYLSSLFREGLHPLQITKTLETQIRKILGIKCFALGLAQGSQISPFNSMNFTLFKARVMPAVIAADEERRKVLAGEDLIFKDLDPEDTKTRSRKKNFASDLFLAPNPKNLYPVFQMFQKSENFTLAELKNALIRLADLDYQFKTSASQERTGIENFIIALCGQIDQGEA